MSDPIFTTSLTNPFGLTDVGGDAKPTFVDIDSDGNLDAFVGEVYGDTLFYRNTGTANSPIFSLQANNFGLTNVGIWAKPAFADIDGDGDFDAFIGNGDANTLFYRNTGTVSNAAFAAPLTNPFGLTVASTGASPTLVDIDADGDLDAFVGGNGNSIQFYRNIGSVSSPKFSLQTGNLGLKPEGGAIPIVAFGDIDSDGDLDAFIITSYSKTMQFYRNTGTASSPSFSLQAGNFGLTNVGDYASPTLVDIDGDGDLDAFVGNDTGNILFFRNNAAVVNHAPTGNVTINDTTPEQNQTLIASHTLADADGLDTISYTWKAGTTVLGSGNSYTVTANEIGKTIKVIANYTDGKGNAESVSSDSTSTVTPPVNHAPTGTATFTLATGTEDTVYTINASDLLQGFSDIDGDNLSVATLSASNGLLTKVNGGWTFTPNAQYNGVVNLKYSVTDGKGGNIAATQSFILQEASSIAGVNITGSDFSTSEESDTAIFSVKLNAVPGHDVTIIFTSSLISEGAIINPTLTFTASNWAAAQTLTVQGQNDYINDGDVNYHVSVGISTIDVDYKALTIPSINLTNLDDGRDAPLTLVGDKNGVPTIDHLTGLDGNDKLYGAYLPDELKGGKGNDKLYGGYDDDLLFGEDGDDSLFGEQDNDYMDGGAGNDFLFGTDGGLDTLIGGTGNDTYYLDFDGLKDVITDKGLASDIDTIIMPFQLTSYTLPTGIEKGTIAEGTQASSLTGNTSDNTLTGNDGKNTLSGAVGRDSLFGGLGNDQLNGGVGNDALSGGAGKDSFVFNTKITANTDNITDFKPIDDTIKLENQIFTKLTMPGALNANFFVKESLNKSPEMR